jgi:membrane associated rhomboid family serine protease
LLLQYHDGDRMKIVLYRNLHDIVSRTQFGSIHQTMTRTRTQVISKRGIPLRGMRRLSKAALTMSLSFTVLLSAGLLSRMPVASAFHVHQSPIIAVPSSKWRPATCTINNLPISIKQQTPQCRHPLVIKRDGRYGQWDGDDLRWTQRLRRRMFRSNIGGSKTPGRSTLIGLNLFMFVYQTINTVQMIARQHPGYWPRHALSMILDTLLGSANVRGPLTTDFVHISYLSNRQPHRFLTAGFLHGDIIHLLLNLDALRRLPSWLETGLGTSLFVTTFIVSIVTGNIGHSIVMAPTAPRTICLGSSGGICGLYGLMYVALTKMGQPRGALSILQNMALLFVFGFFIEAISNAGHIGGFIGGIIMGILCVPRYQRDYQMRRKNSLQADVSPAAYRQVMGFGIAPSKRGFLPVQAIWIATGLLFVAEPRFRAIPANVVRGLWNPGSLSWY